ncbi:hypothetical protein A584_24832 [Pseudomonas syringae pv. theae ICMP 3923]|uniref:Uncharacterized protein n=1 Tax=Pseudomonas syringae pv. theae TaxID=103985 RepID=A0A0Q0DPH3_PSESX|nr:hypothetical protein [Pseudomonas syringae]EPM66642.1 hypothetical protein A584_24832 [Pseudomonas syringae pv. theae ICMP 3923]KPZ30579.1 hypothetical protein AN901_204201 [Pseudomonas syringae pv. theae]MBL3873204.1 hypothetical protein [Pseudomonas syringae pv. theae]RMT69498.1 hypothetical protein ALP44_01534 [Pseudomonas syringae pv. theae]GKQ32923.1 hypothetical protein PSTH68_25410 [Pseudomonas syringae pv. theae]
MSFVERCLEGSVQEEEIEQFVEDWHEGREGADMELHEYLGMSWDEYQIWVTTPSVLSVVLAAKKRGISLEQQLADQANCLRSD